MCDSLTSFRNSEIRSRQPRMAGEPGNPKAWPPMRWIAEAGGSGMGEGPYRVVQWATGNIGLRSLRAVIDHPELELVGLYVYSDAKAGRDAGELCGTRSTGVRATQDIEEIIALRA